MISFFCFKIVQFINFINFEGFIYYIFDIDPSKSLQCFIWKNIDYYTNYISFSLEEYGERDPFYVRYFNYKKFSKEQKLYIV